MLCWSILFKRYYSQKMFHMIYVFRYQGFLQITFFHYKITSLATKMKNKIPVRQENAFDIIII